jgi:hypothetical protein
MRAETYNKPIEKSKNGEVPAALKFFNEAATRLIGEVELGRETVCELMILKLRVSRQVLGLQGRSE